jgi:hypothetical protein
LTRIRKQIEELTPADLEAYPIWEFAGDEEAAGQDEATVRPLAATFYNRQTYGVVRTKFRLADGTLLTGFLTPPPPSDPNAPMLPQMITAAGHVSLWFCLKPSAKQLEILYGLLERTADEVFPVLYETDFPVENGPVSGRMDGFQGYAGSGSREILTIK